MTTEPQPIAFAALPPLPSGGGSWAAEIWLATGHLRKRTDASLSLVSTLAIFGVVAGVATLNIVLGVMNGFEEDFRDKMLASNAHILVTAQGGIADAAAVLEGVESVDGVVAATPFVTTDALLRSAQGATGIVLRGIDPERAPAVTKAQEAIVAGPAGLVATPEEAAAVLALLVDAQVLLGKDLAESLRVAPGDTVELIDPLGSLRDPLSGPRRRRLTVIGIMHSGWAEYDAKWAYVALPLAQELSNDDTVDGIEVLAADGDASTEVAMAIEARLPGVDARDWKELNARAFHEMQLAKGVMALILLLVVIVAALLILSTLLILVMTKGRQIAILRAMGATRGTILRVFVMVGSFIGVVGTALGTVLGLIGCALLDVYGFPLSTDVYTMSELAVSVHTADVLAIAAASLGISFVATLYPASRAAMVDPVEGLRYE